tara:strand:+ start:193 stop:450 length:258 start_codon:yes stop_codon:yes gene_type:complete
MAEETNPQATTTAPSLNINDLLSVVKIIDACSERGAFKGNEMASVGSVRDRLATFAEANMPKQEEPEEEMEEIGEGFKPGGTDFD